MDRPASFDTCHEQNCCCVHCAKNQLLAWHCDANSAATIVILEKNYRHCDYFGEHYLVVVAAEAVVEVVDYYIWMVCSSWKPAFP